MEKINPLFTAAVQQDQAFKRFLEEHVETDPGRLAQLETTCDAYDAYAGAVLEAADKIKEQFFQEQKVWSPWYRTAMHVVFELDLLRKYMLMPYKSLELSTDESKVTRLQNIAEQKELETKLILKKHFDLLKEHKPKDANELESHIDELEKYQQEMRKTLAKYEKNREISPMTNLVDTAQSKEKMEQILIQRAMFSPGSAGGFASIYDKDESEELEVTANPLFPRDLNESFKKVETEEKQSENSDHEDETPSRACQIKL